MTGCFSSAENAKVEGNEKGAYYSELADFGVGHTANEDAVGQCGELVWYKCLLLVQQFVNGR